MKQQHASVRLLLLVVPALAGLGCGAPLLDATFTSAVVQLETCKVIGDRPEVCSQEETVETRRVRLVEREDANVWLYGITRDGDPDRATLGTRDSSGGFLFIDEVVHNNTLSSCTVTDRLEITLAVDPNADTTVVGTDPCIALVGRENETTISSAGCDSANDPPLTAELIARRRWETPVTCTP